MTFDDCYADLAVCIPTTIFPAANSNTRDDSLGALLWGVWLIWPTHYQAHYFLQAYDG